MVTLDKFEIKKRRELQARALSEGPRSPVEETQDMEPRPCGRASARLASKVEKFAVFQRSVLRVSALKCQLILVCYPLSFIRCQPV